MVKSGQLPGKGHSEAEGQEEANRSRPLGESVCQSQSRKRACDTFMVITYKLSQGKSPKTPKLTTLANLPNDFKNHTSHRKKWITESSIYVTFVLKFLFLYISSLFPQLSTVEVKSWHFI